MASLVWLSDSPTIATGFGRVTRQVLDLLAKRVEGELTCLGWGYRGTAEAAVGRVLGRKKRGPKGPWKHRPED